MRDINTDETTLVSGGLMMAPGLGDAAGAIAGGAFADFCSEVGFAFGGMGGALIGLGVAASADYNSSHAWAAQAVNDAYTSGAAL
ncbi:MAG TPA: hypothetical protein VHA37_02925 [Candidatus Saccharimonadales bacterium]|jgi:hypothetical protein|nr:hypothetical protein [Candidatus Saccharimonadales bacterium]